MDKTIGIIGAYLLCALIIIGMSDTSATTLIPQIVTGVMGLITGYTAAKVTPPPRNG